MSGKEASFVALLTRSLHEARKMEDARRKREDVFILSIINGHKDRDILLNFKKTMILF
jgi:hypothetical protein